ncbi:ligand-binding sensor domain-containing diguanylate cyclase [Silanimonas algicola]
MASAGVRATGRNAWHRIAACALALVLLAVALPVAASGQRALKDLNRNQWTTREGLPHNSINAIGQTAEGYLWFATWEGVVRYNGHEFAVFDRREIPVLADAALRALHVDHDGRLVLGGARGTLVRRELDGAWRSLPDAPAMVTQVEGDAESRLWVGTETFGVMQIDPTGRGKVLEPDDGVDVGTNYGLARDARGGWWAAHAAGLYRVGDDNLHPAGARGLPAGPVTAITADGDRLLVGTPSGLYVADARQVPLDFQPLDPQLAGISISRLLPDGQGGLWIGTLNDGLMRWTTRGLDRLGVGGDRPSSRVLSLFIDREGSLWVGTNGGLFRFTDSPFTNTVRHHGLPDDFVRTVLARDDGSVLIGTAQGLAVHAEDGTVTSLGGGTPLEGASVLSLADAGQGRVWVGTHDDGAMLWDGQRVLKHLHTAEGLPSNEIRALQTDGDRLWLGTTRGLVRWEAGTLRRWDETSGLPTNFIVALHLGVRRELWVGTGLGAVIVEDDRLRPLDLGVFEEAKYAFGFLHDATRDHVWIASDRGLLRFDVNGRPTGAVGLAQGLPYEKVFGLLRDPQDQLWASGNRGVLRLDMTRLNDVADGAAVPLDVERFTEADGMASAQCNGGSQPVVAMDRRGRQWFATSVGAARIDPADLQRYTRNAPPVVIESITADGQGIAPAGAAAVTVPGGTRRIELRYAGLGFVLSERLRYRYRLDGFDQDWIERGGETLAEYTTLPPGRYTFRVEAAHPRGEWGQSRASVVIDVAPLWWERTLVVWGFVVAATLGAGLLLRWRLHRLAANEQRLARLVEERTLEIEQQKARLRFQAEEFARQAREDALTGINNRRAFDEALAREFARARRNGAPLSIAIVDLDHFKAINDRFSHAVGDEVLKRVAQRLKNDSRGFDVVARWGGEEFAMLLPETALGSARAACERLRESIQAVDLSDIDPALRITASVGVAEAAGLDDHHRLLLRADEALYRAKANGRNRVEG